MDNKASILTFSWAAIFKIIVAVIFLYIFYLLKDLVIWFIFAVIIAILFNYLIDILEKKKIPRIISATVLYLLVFAFISFFIYQTAPLFLNELTDFAERFPQYLQRVSPLFEKIGIEAFKDTNTLLQTLRGNINEASASLISALFSIFGGAAATVLVVSMAFFISLEKQFVKRVLGAFAPVIYQEYLFNLWGKSKQKVSGWFITRMIGVLFVGASAYIVLRILGVEYAFTLSLLAGIFDLVPIIGPLVAGVVIVLIVALVSLPKAIFAGVAFVIIQQLENNLLFPMLFKRFTGLSPVLVLLSLAVGGAIWGPAGAILAIPLGGVFFEVLKDYLKRIKKDKEKALQEQAQEQIVEPQPFASSSSPEPDIPEHL